MYRVLPMDLPFAEEISRWTYPDEYKIYSFEPSDEVIEELLCGDYYACVDQQVGLIGYFCYGASAQIPTVENLEEPENALYIGLGLRPELCGQSLGAEFMLCGMKYARQNLGASSLRLAVAAFNLRAQRLYEKLGFRKTMEVTHRFTRMPFFLMELDR